MLTVVGKIVSNEFAHQLSVSIAQDVFQWVPSKNIQRIGKCRCISLDHLCHLDQVQSQLDHLKII